VEKRRRASLGAKSKQKRQAGTFAQWLQSIPKEQRKLANNPATRRIFAEKQQVLRQIRNSPRLMSDFDFFLGSLDWDTECLLQHLYWDSNMMHADPQTLVRKEKARIWTVDRRTLSKIRTTIRVLSEQMEQISETDFSPARTAILRDEKGMRLHPADEKYLLTAFRNLPDVLRFYGYEVSRKLANVDKYWLSSKKDWKSIVEQARQSSLYEKIRAKTGQYHVVRLHRLVNISRQVQGLPPVNQRAFIVWLNRLKKRHEKICVSQESPSSLKGSPAPAQG